MKTLKAKKINKYIINIFKEIDGEDMAIYITAKKSRSEQKIKWSDLGLEELK